MSHDKEVRDSLLLKLRVTQALCSEQTGCQVFRNLRHEQSHRRGQSGRLKTLQQCISELSEQADCQRFRENISNVVFCPHKVNSNVATQYVLLDPMQTSVNMAAILVCDGRRRNLLRRLVVSKKS